jgi:TRAP-type transport system small permease protein
LAAGCAAAVGRCWLLFALTPFLMTIDIDSGPKVMGDDGEFHAVDEAVDLSGTPVEAWASVLLFWALAGVVFTQFFTRYFLNDSASWTEEIARYLLIGVVFVGASIGVAKNNHIQVDLIYRYLPAGVSRALATLVDVLRIGFFGSMTVYTVQMMQKMGNYQMTIVDLPMNIVYGVVLFGFAAMTVRSLWVARVHWQRGYSVLERPESTMADR